MRCHLPELRAEISEDFPLGFDYVPRFYDIARIMKVHRKIIFRRIKFNFPAEQEIIKKRHGVPPRTVEFAYEYL